MIPILVHDPFLALGMTVNFPPWKPFLTFRSGVTAVSVKKNWLTAQKVLPSPTVGVLSASKSPSALARGLDYVGVWLDWWNWGANRGLVSRAAPCSLSPSCWVKNNLASSDCWSGQGKFPWQKFFFQKNEPTLKSYFFQGLFNCPIATIAVWYAPPQDCSDCRLVNFIDVTLACEDANSKLEIEICCCC